MRGGRIRGLDQRALARKARLSQSTVSNIENLEKSIGSPKRRVSREDLIKVLTSGLNLEQPKIDAGLWLYDCQPLTEEEIQVYVQRVLAQGLLRELPV
jgi:transcriptional regulator with XRE-family HTH domain